VRSLPDAGSAESFGAVQRVERQRTDVRVRDSTFWRNPGSARCLAVRGFEASLPIMLGSANILPMPRPASPPPEEAEATKIRRQKKDWVEQLTFGIANLSQALLGCGSVFELDACLVCLDRGVVLTCTVKSCSLASVSLRPRGVYLDALEGLRSVPRSVRK
jgi:hypothetical protein